MPCRCQLNAGSSAALAECSDEVQGVVFRMVSVVENPRTKPEERQRALATIADALALSPDNDLEKTQEAAFADRLHELIYRQVRDAARTG